MYTDSEGIILKQIKIASGRRMIVLLTEKYGKISAGTSIAEKGKNKSSLALRPFTKGRYELYKNRDTFNINGAETIQSFYAIGEDVDKYLAASYVLELTDKILLENEPAKAMFLMLSEFLEILAKRKSEFDTLVIGYQIKTLAICGLAMGQNPLLSSLGDDKINVVKYIESRPLSALAEISVAEEIRTDLMLFIKKYFIDHLGIENLKSEGLRL